MIQTKASSTKPADTAQNRSQNGVTKKSTWSFRQKQTRSISIPEPKPFKSQENQGSVEDKLSRWRGWLHKSTGEIVQPSVSTSLGKTPENLTNEAKPSAESKSKRWCKKGPQKSPKPPNTLASTESESYEILSTESIDILGGNVLTIVKSLEEDDSRPIVFGNYSGEPVYQRNIEEPAIFNSQLVRFNQFDQFEEATYHSWNIWKVGHDGTKEMGNSIECKMDFVDFFKKFNYQKVYIMRSILVPNHSLFKNGYLVKLKLLSKKESEGDMGLQVFMKCCRNSILNNVPNNAIKINVCGFTYTRKGSLTQITLWIHPIMNMSFDISNQVKSLIKLLNLETNINKITLVDVNNGSKTEITES